MPPDIGKHFNSICMWNMTPDQTLHVKVFKKRLKELMTLINNICCWLLSLNLFLLFC